MMARRPPKATRGGRCNRCGIAWAWIPSAAAPVSNAHCPKCGYRLARTTLATLSVVPVVLCFPWFRCVGKGRGERWRCPDERPVHGCKWGCVGQWYTLTLDTPGSVVRQWARLDVDVPEWLRAVPS